MTPARPRTVAVIPARGGSKGLPGKNLAQVAGRPLVARTVAAALGAAAVDRVVVSSDDAAILEVAAAAGAVALRRPAALSGDAAPSEAALLHALDALAAEGERFELLVFLQCTSPFTRARDVDALVAALDGPARSALLVAPSHGFLWRRDAEGHGRGVNHDAALPRARRQDLAPEWRETGAGYAVRVDALREGGHRFPAPVALVETDLPALEIDDAEDLALARALAAARGEAPPAPDPARLRAVRAVVTDFDGVHTDDRVAVREDGLESVTCSRADGMGVALLGAAGVPLAILSKEVNPVVAARAAKLGCEAIQGVDDKPAALGRWLAARGLAASEIAYLGNDVNDLGCLDAAGLAFAPADAHPEVTRRAHVHVLPAPGGRGAVRALCDLLLGARAGGG
jgi:N-acylneuraminate cytidylyltransferase